MATFAYDATKAPPLEMDFPLINDTYALGEFLACGVTDGTNLGALVSAAGIYDNMVGILCQDATTTTGTHAGKNITEGRVIYNPYAVYMTEHNTTTGISITDIDAGGDGDPAFACTSSKGYPNQGGGWVYRNVDAGKGSLHYLSSSAVSGTICSLTLVTTETVSFTTDTDVILIPPPFSDGYAVDLTATGIDGSDIDAPATPGTTGLAVGIMDNWIYRNAQGMVRLRATSHDALTDLDLSGEQVRFFTELCLAPSHFLTP